MADSDALRSFDFDQVSKPGLFLKFQAGKSVTVRVLTTDPVLQQQEFEDKITGEINLNLKFNFIVYNITEKKAQIWGATPAMARKIGELHVDPDFGANIRQMDIKITPTGEKKERRYDMQVLRHSGNQTVLTAEQIKEAQSIDLDDVVKDGTRMSIWKPAEKTDEVAAEAAEDERHQEQAHVDEIIEDITDEPINLDDISF